MNTSKHLLEIQKKFLTQDALYFNVDSHLIDDSLSLKEFLKKLILEYNRKYATHYVKSNNHQTPKDKHRSVEDIFKLTVFYKPETQLEEVLEELILLNEEDVLSTLKCGGIGKLTFYPKGDRYEDFGFSSDSSYDESEQGESEDISLNLTVKQIFDYFNPSDIRYRRKNNIKKEEKIVKNTMQPLKGVHQIRIRSRHPSHNVLRRNPNLKLGFRSVFRLGSITEVANAVDEGGNVVEINSTDGVRNSSDKKRMKRCFTDADVKTATWFIVDNGVFYQQEAEGNNKKVPKEELPFPLIAKSRTGSRGEGNYKLDSLEQLNTFMRDKDLSRYIFEKFYSFLREYRAHVTADGCFYTCRKMLKNNAKEENKWQRHDDNCVWIREENPSFDKPVNWNAIIADCVKALESLGLDIGAFDIKVQSAKDSKGNARKNPEYIIIESCSAPSFGEVTAQKYVEILPVLATKLAKECGII